MFADGYYALGPERPRVIAEPFSTVEQMESLLGQPDTVTDEGDTMRAVWYVDPKDTTNSLELVAEFRVAGRVNALKTLFYRGENIGRTASAWQMKRTEIQGPLCCGAATRSPSR